MFQSAINEEIPVTGNCIRVECCESYYEIQNMGVKVRRSSSTTDEVESESESLGSLPSNHSVLAIDQNIISKFSLFFKMKPQMARCFVADLSEETSILKESLVKLKKKLENSKCMEFLSHH